MTNEAEDPNDEKPAVQTEPTIVKPVLDWHLQFLISLVEDGENHPIGVVLNTSAGIITGQIVSYKEWAEVIVEQMTGNLQGEDAEEATELVRKFYLEDTSPGEEIKIHERNLIHLKDAKHFVPPDHFTPNNSVYMRVRLAEVVGWSLGHMERS